MSILAYTGLPGHGKSYSVVENVIIPALREGRVVAHNLELNIPALSVVCGRDVVGQLVQIPKNDATGARLVELCPAGSVIVIDEIWRYWGAGLKASDVPRPEMAFFKEHRHRVGADGKSSEIVVIDQELGSGVARFIRDLVELTYIHTKLSAIGSKKSFRVDVYTRAQNANKPQKAALIRKMMGRYKPEVWNCYISHTQSESKIGDAGLEKMPDGRGTVFKSWPVRLAILAALLLPLLIYRSATSFSGMSKAGTAGGVGGASHPRPLPAPLLVSVAPKPQPVPPSLTVSPASPAVALRQPSAQWRLIGVVERVSGGDGYALLASTTGRRKLDLKTYCKPSREEGGDYTCDLDGEWVTRWSGSATGIGVPTMAEGVAPVLPRPSEVHDGKTDHRNKPA